MMSIEGSQIKIHAHLLWELFGAPKKQFCEHMVVGVNAEALRAPRLGVLC